MHEKLCSVLAEFTIFVLLRAVELFISSYFHLDQRAFEFLKIAMNFYNNESLLV